MSAETPKPYIPPELPPLDKDGHIVDPVAWALKLALEAGSFEAGITALHRAQAQGFIPESAEEKGMPAWQRTAMAEEQRMRDEAPWSVQPRPHPVDQNDAEHQFRGEHRQDLEVLLGEDDEPAEPVAAPLTRRQMLDARRAAEPTTEIGADEVLRWTWANRNTTPVRAPRHRADAQSVQTNPFHESYARFMEEQANPTLEHLQDKLGRSNYHD